VARRLKTFVTSVGFFDLAVAAPSMKAALEAWGANPNAFHQGFATETHDPEVVAATMKNPGVVLRRPVGTTGPFREGAELPEGFSLPKTGKQKSTPHKSKSPQVSKKLPEPDPEAQRAAIVSFEKEKARREKQRAAQAATAARARKKRDRAIEKAEADLRKASERHDAQVARLEKERASLDRRLDTENKRWGAELRRLEAALDRSQR
jgi:hypothetical protein